MKVSVVCDVEAIRTCEGEEKKITKTYIPYNMPRIEVQPRGLCTYPDHIPASVNTGIYFKTKIVRGSITKIRQTIRLLSAGGPIFLSIRLTRCTVHKELLRGCVHCNTFVMAYKSESKLT